MKEKLSLHITKRSAHVLQWSKAIFLKVGDYIKTITRAKYLNRIIELSLLASFLNTTRKKKVKKFAFDHCKTCSERFVIWRDNFSFIFQRKEDKEMLEKRCYTVQELQEILGVSRSTIYNRCWWSRFGTSGKSIG